MNNNLPSNWPFPSSKSSQLQTSHSAKSFFRKWFYLLENKNHFHINDFTRAARNYGVRLGGRKKSVFVYTRSSSWYSTNLSEMVDCKQSKLILKTVRTNRKSVVTILVTWPLPLISTWRRRTGDDAKAPRRSLGVRRSQAFFLRAMFAGSSNPRWRTEMR